LLRLGVGDYSAADFDRIWAALERCAMASTGVEWWENEGRARTHAAAARCRGGWVRRLLRAVRLSVAHLRKGAPNWNR
jgi:hypothetical protein